jgi:Cu/Ag efflux protein CusF
MPPMTMVFQVRKPDQLDGLKVGDKVQFVADKQGSQYGVSELQKAE